MGNSVDDILSSAKAALNHAEETSRYNNPPVAPIPIPEGLKGKNEPPKAEHSNAPYSLAHTLRSHKSDVDSALREIGQ